eukprot:2555427-Rhodomonas_salina.3
MRAKRGEQMLGRRNAQHPVQSANPGLHLLSQTICSALKLFKPDGDTARLGAGDRSSQSSASRCSPRCSLPPRSRRSRLPPPRNARCAAAAACASWLLTSHSTPALLPRAEEACARTPTTSAAERRGRGARGPGGVWGVAVGAALGAVVAGAVQRR